MSALAESPAWTARQLTDAEQADKKAMLELLQQDRIRLLAEQPFIAALAMRLELRPVIDARLPTAATDGHKLFFSVPFMRELSVDERLFIMAHEVWHCAALHFVRRGERDPKRWNVAIDHEVNNILIEQGFRMPAGGIHFARFAGDSAEAVYERLDSALPDRGRMADLHDPESALADPSDRSNTAPADKPVPMDADYDPGGDSRVWREWPRRVHAAAQQAYRNPGDQPGWLQRLLSMIGHPTLPWQELLRRFVERVRADRFQWTPPNRRYAGQGLILPGRGGERLSLAVAIDTSGSTTACMGHFMAELNGILAGYGRYEVHLMGCDTRVHYDHQFSDSNPPPRQLELGGGGGTDLVPVFRRLREMPPQALVFLTDGLAVVPSVPPPFPVLWCLTPDGQKPAGWGEAVWLPDREGSV